jgi:hypothetical protein
MRGKLVLSSCGLGNECRISRWVESSYIQMSEDEWTREWMSLDFTPEVSDIVIPIHTHKGNIIRWCRFFPCSPSLIPLFRSDWSWYVLCFPVMIAPWMFHPLLDHCACCVSCKGFIVQIKRVRYRIQYNWWNMIKGYWLIDDGSKLVLGEWVCAVRKVGIDDAMHEIGCWCIVYIYNGAVWGMERKGK